MFLTNFIKIKFVCNCIKNSNLDFWLNYFVILTTSLKKGNWKKDTGYRITDVIIQLTLFNFLKEVCYVRFLH